MTNTNQIQKQITTYQKDLQDENCEDTNEVITNVIDLLDTDLQTKFHQILNNYHFYTNQEVLAQIVQLIKDQDITTPIDLANMIVDVDDRQWHYQINEYLFQDYFEGSAGDYFENGLDELKQALDDLLDLLE